jgi:FkbM family methyltransferase
VIKLVMTNSTLGRYRNLFAYVRNWTEYFREKRQRPFAPIEFTTTGQPLTFVVPTWPLFVVFKEIFLADFYEIRSLVRRLPPHPVVIDVGANAGYFAMILFSRVPGARLFAYEPIEENHRLLAANIARNAALAGRATVTHAAVTGAPAESIELFAESEASSVTASVFREFSPADNTHTVRVPATSLADIVRTNGLARVDLLKMDCEGSEYPIIYETPGTVWPLVQNITLEVHDLPGRDRNVVALTTYLESVGYQCSRTAAANGCWAMVARRT